MKMYNVEGEVHKRYLNGSYRVKAKILDPTLAMYINGIIVFPPSEKRDEWTVYTPKVLNARIIEFAKSSSLWKEVQSACIDAVKLERSYSQMNEAVGLQQYNDLSNEEFEKQIKDELDKLPF